MTRSAAYPTMPTPPPSAERDGLKSAQKSHTLRGNTKSFTKSAHRVCEKALDAPFPHPEWPHFCAEMPFSHHFRTYFRSLARHGSGTWDLRSRDAGPSTRDSGRGTWTAERETHDWDLGLRTQDSAFCGLRERALAGLVAGVIRVRAAGVVGHVDDLTDLWNGSLN